ncbi:bifunctional riboflavin kinase/FAD synthetase [candidate division KSB1 bacterium]
MEVIRNIEDIQRISGGVVTVGTFDGIHIAHQAILKRVIEYAKEHNCNSSVVTFDPHPRLVVGKEPGKNIELLTTTEEKIGLFRSFDIDRAIIIPFTNEFSRTSPEDFLNNVLCKRIGLQKLIIGYDHGFGRNRAGGIVFLRKYEEMCGFKLNVQEPVTNVFGAVSSTQIRTFLKEGEVDKAKQSLGRPYSFSGKVIKGDERGRTLNFPTANIAIDNDFKAIPGNGVYVVEIMLDDKKYSGVMNIGNRPTFDSKKAAMEVHIFNFSKNIYNESVTINFLKRIREEIKFDSPELLKKQIEADCIIAQEFFSGQ